jgi:CDP-glucose 4,6-dehydratase
MKPPDLTAFDGVRVLVTGHTGFKGAWLCEWLLGAGAKLAGIALVPEMGRPSLFAELGLANRMGSVVGDIRNLGTVAAAVSEFEPEVIFHLAAQSLVRRSYADPVGTFATNVMGSVHVIEAARHSESVKALVCITSDKCYENQEWVWGYRESDPLGGTDPYSASKAAAEIAAGSYLRAILSPDGRVRLATARGGNVIGGGDWSEDRLVPDLVRAIGNGETIVLRNPAALRPWQHVLELLRGYLMLGAGLLRGESLCGAWNFGPGREDEITVAELTDRFAAAYAGDHTVLRRVEASPLREAQTLRLDISKAHSLLNWRPTLGIDRAVQMTADWYRERLSSPERVGEITRAQIAEYMTAIAMPI